VCVAVQSEACKTLTDIAKAQWELNEPDVSDDISCVIVFFKPPDGTPPVATGVTGVASAAVASARFNPSAPDELLRAVPEAAAA
jgi:hypothetical protein